MEPREAAIVDPDKSATNSGAGTNPITEPFPDSRLTKSRRGHALCDGGHTAKPTNPIGRMHPGCTVRATAPSGDGGRQSPSICKPFCSIGSLKIGTEFQDRAAQSLVLPDGVLH